ncbi:MAG: hypothetical protein ACNS62_18130 [Candidatus Cyclobacteriaceae bacterium M3_2C_046]
MRNLKNNHISLEEKAIKIMEAGALVSSEEFFQLNIKLYRVEDEFLEVWYNTFLKKVTRVENLDQKKINPYLKYLAISNLN